MPGSPSLGEDRVGCERTERRRDEGSGRARGRMGEVKAGSGDGWN